MYIIYVILIWLTFSEKKIQTFVTFFKKSKKTQEIIGENHFFLSKFAAFCQIWKSEKMTSKMALKKPFKIRKSGFWQK